jgi:hypothetical protein
MNYNRYGHRRINVALVVSPTATKARQESCGCAKSFLVPRGYSESIDASTKVCPASCVQDITAWMDRCRLRHNGAMKTQRALIIVDNS